MYRTTVEWHDYLPDNSPQFLNKFLDGLMGKPIDSCYETRTHLIERLFQMVHMNFDQKRAVVENAKSLHGEQLIDIFTEDLVPKEEVYRTNIIDKKDEKAACEEILNRLADWLFVLGVHDFDLAVGKFVSTHDGKINNDNLRYLLDKLVEHDSADSFIAVYEHFADRLYCNYDLYERRVFAEYIETLYLTISKTSLQTLSSVSPRRGAEDTEASMVNLIVLFRTLVENFFISGLNPRFIEVALEDYGKMCNAPGESSSKDQLQAAIASYHLNETGNVGEYLKSINDVFVKSFNKANNSLKIDDVFQCFDYYIKVYPFFNEEQRNNTIEKLEFILGNVMKIHKNKLHEKLQLLVSGQDKKLGKNRAIALFLPFMQNTYFALTEVLDSKDSVYPSSKIRVILKAISNEDIDSLKPLINEYLTTNQGKYSQADINNLFLILHSLNRSSAEYLFDTYQQMHDDTYGFKYITCFMISGVDSEGVKQLVRELPKI